MADSSFERTFAALPPDLKQEVEDFAEFLLLKRSAKNEFTGDAHPLANLAGAWRNEPLSDEDLLPERTLGRDVDL